MNRRTLGIIFMALMILGIAIPFTTLNTITYATIVGRPVIYYNGSNATQLHIPAGAEIALNLTGMVISGAQIWIWFSTDGSAVITPSDAWYIGPINVYQIYNVTPTLSESTVQVSGTFGGGTINVKLGNGTVVFNIPKQFEGDVVYWIKVTDVNPALRPNIPSSDVAVSVNNFTVTPVFCVNPDNGTSIVPKQPITICAYATSVGAEYNITWNATGKSGLIAENIPSQVNTIAAQDYNPAWNWTGIEYTFPATDLGLLPGDNATNIWFNVTQGTDILASFEFLELNRTVTLYGELGSETPANGAVLGDNTAPWYKIDREYNISLEYFVYEGSVTITLSNETLGYSAVLASNVPLGPEGNYTNLTITIPTSIPHSDYYWLNISDGDVVVSFKVYVKITPWITISPEKGYVGSQAIVTLHRFDDFVNDTVTIWFEGGCPELLANTTITAPNMNVTVTIPEATWGEHVVYAADKYGNWATFDAGNTTFFVEAKVWVEPSVITEGQEFLTIYATGLNETGYYDIMLDQGTLLWGFEAGPCGSLEVTVPATGLKPGLHVVAVYYEYWATPNVTTPQLYATFTVSGPTLEDVLNAVNGLSSQLNDVVVGINDLKALITSLGDDITLKLQSINNTLATLIIEKNNEVIARLCTKLNELNATIVSIKGDTVELKTAVGEIQTTLQALKSSNAELKDLIITKSGEIEGVIQTAAGNITANLNALEQLIKSGLKVDTQTLLSKIDEIKSQLGSISGSVSSVSSKLDQLASTLDDLKSMLSNVQSTVSNVQSTVTDIKSNLQDIKNTASSLASKIESTANDIKSYISSQNSDLKKAVDGISGTVSTYGIISIILIIIAIAVSGYGIYKKKE